MVILPQRFRLLFTSALSGALMTTASAENLRLASFQADATPAIGSPVAYVAARSIEDPLSARGIVLLGAGTPIVLCAVDWIGIGNAGHDAWCAALADAAGTTPDRVSVHVLHQHDGPRCDFDTETLLAEHGLGGTRFDSDFARRTMAATAAAIQEALPKAKAITHLGIGQARVEKVASNRRILGPLGSVLIQRQSASKNPDAQAAPEGTIDPFLKAISFWHDAQPLACLTYYATHPQSHYGKGDVTAEFVGLARNQRELELGGLPHIHFNGAGGNVAAGKYNDGSPANRPVLTARLADGMKRAWEATIKSPLTAADIAWKTLPVKLPPGAHLQRSPLEAQLADVKGDARSRLSAATKLAYLTRLEKGHRIPLHCLTLGSVRILHMPGELFVEYQLAAQKMRPDLTVCMAAYGDYGTGYIGTEIAYSQGGYETQPTSSNTAPQVERVLMEAMRTLLGTP
jgi:hypothetical protein